MTQPILTTYKTLSTEFYDLVDHPNHDAALALYMNYTLQAQGPILEPMCGTGRFLIPMLQAGLEVEGFDASEHMLDALRKKYALVKAQPAPVWQQFVQNFTSSKRYNLIFVPYGSWGLITDLSISKKCLEIMHHHLAPGGKLVLEIETVASGPKESGVWRRAEYRRPDGSQIVLNALISYQPLLQMFISSCRYELIFDNNLITTEHEEFKQYLYRFDEMDHLLVDIGFKQVKKYQDHNKSLATNQNAPLLIYECIR